MEIPKEIRQLKWWTVALMVVPSLTTGWTFRECILQTSGQYVKIDEYKKLTNENVELKMQKSNIEQTNMALSNQLNDLKKSEPVPAPKPIHQSKSIINKTKDSKDTKNTNIIGDGNTIH
ncbi:MAG: hypothetical protein V4615_04165 [Bacteroidota bacterium]